MQLSDASGQHALDRHEGSSVAFQSAWSCCTPTRPWPGRFVLSHLFKEKKEVQFYDYVDVHVGILEKMYQKGLSGYASIGYPAKAESVAHEPAEMIVDNTSLLPVYLNDMMNAAREMMIVSPFVARRRALQMLSAMKPALEKKVSVAVVTRPPNIYRDKDRPTLEEPLASLQSSGGALCVQTQHSSKIAIVSGMGASIFSAPRSAQGSIMHLDGPNIAQNLLEDLGKSINA